MIEFNDLTSLPFSVSWKARRRYLEGRLNTFYTKVDPGSSDRRATYLENMLTPLHTTSNTSLSKGMPWYKYIQNIGTFHVDLKNKCRIAHSMQVQVRST